MGMRLGDNLRVTLFGESHGLCVGALVEGMPAGTEIDETELSEAILRRRPGRKGLSTRSEGDDCEIMTGVYEGKATGWPILLLTRNSDTRSSDYSFLPDHPRPGHADMVEDVRSEGSNDPRGGGSQSARLTFGLVAAGSQMKALMDEAGWSCSAHLHSVGEPWFDGIEPALARGLMAIPGARAVEFSSGVRASIMRGTEHNDAWLPSDSGPIPEGADEAQADGALGGRSTSAPICARVHFKPPSSLPQEQFTLHLPSNEVQSLKVTGRHDPVIGPRAAPVVESVAMLVVTDLGMLGGYIGTD